MAKKKRTSGETRTVTVRLHAVHDPKQNLRIATACGQTDAVHNRVGAHLLTHRSDEPLRKSSTGGITGTYGLLTEWRGADDGLQDIPLLAAGGAAAAAADQVAEWEMANHEQSIEMARTADHAWSSSGRRRCADRGAPAPPIIRAPGDHAFRLAAKDGAPIGAVRCTERMSEPENTL